MKDNFAEIGYRSKEIGLNKETMIRNLLLVAIGGGLGSIMRYLLTYIWPLNNTNTLPVATLIANVLGCLLIGFIGTYLTKTFGGSPQLRLFLTVGFCGGLTTFSTFIHLLLCAGYLALSVSLGFMALYCGIWLAEIVTEH